MPSSDHQPKLPGQPARELFAQVVGVLAEGDLQLPPPFTFAASAALARNIDSGDTALAIFSADIRRPTRIRIVITEECGDLDMDPREIVDTAVSRRQAVAILHGLIEEWTRTTAAPAAAPRTERNPHGQTHDPCADRRH